MALNAFVDSFVLLSVYFHGTDLYLHCGAILLDHRVGTFIGRRWRKSVGLSYSHFLMPLHLPAFTCIT